MKKKLGIYICHCGGNISDYVDVEKVREAIKGEDAVFMAKTTMFACGDTNQKEMVQDIKEQGLDSIIVASCSPKLHLNTFRNCSARAGLNPYTYVHANIREQASWAHSDDKKGATEKAILLVKAAIAKARYAEALETFKINAEKSVAVIGGGVAGMKAALELSKMGTPVLLVERENSLGGRVAQWKSLHATNESGKSVVERLYTELMKRDNIVIHTATEVVDQSGSIGNFKLVMKKRPTFNVESLTESEISKAIKACPVEVSDEFNFGLTKRKAIYKTPEGLQPIGASIDMKHCTKCFECVKVCPEINFSQTEETIEFTVGSVLMATGFDNYTPQADEYGYGETNVITLPQLKRLMALNENKLIYKGKEIKNIAYIYCVGSRQVEGENKYCSRSCCTSTIHTALELKKQYKDIVNVHFTRGVRSYGKNEILYREASNQGDVFIQVGDESPAEIIPNGHKITVKANDILSANKTLEYDADLVVLVTAMVPRADNAVGTVFKLPKGRDKFFNEIHMKLRPVETAIDGVTLAGTCQGPKNVMESVNSALAAATKSYSIVNKGVLELEPIVVSVDKDKCTWCDACTKACPFSAIDMVEENGKNIAQINISTCKGCGMCLPVCPTDAIELVGYTNEAMESMIDALS